MADADERIEAVRGQLRDELSTFFASVLRGDPKIADDLAAKVAGQIRTELGGMGLADQQKIDSKLAAIEGDIAALSKRIGDLANRTPADVGKSSSPPQDHLGPQELTPAPPVPIATVGKKPSAMISLLKDVATIIFAIGIVLNIVGGLVLLKAFAHGGAPAAVGKEADQPDTFAENLTQPAATLGAASGGGVSVQGSGQDAVRDTNWKKVLTAMAVANQGKIPKAIAPLVCGDSAERAVASCISFVQAKQDWLDTNPNLTGVAQQVSSTLNCKPITSNASSETLINFIEQCLSKPSTR